MIRDDRGVSVTVNYVLGLGIMFILVSALLLTGSNFVENQRETSVRTELEVLGEQVAADVAMADRLAQTVTTNEQVEVTRSLPGRVAGSSYSIAIEDSSDPYVVVEAADPDISVKVEMEVDTTVEADTIDGGEFVVKLDAGNLTLEGA